MSEMMCGCFCVKYTEVVVSCEKNGSARTRQTTLKVRGYFLTDYTEVVVSCVTNVSYI